MTGVVEVADAAAGYGDRVVWRDLSLDLDPGAYVAVVGANGSGKSTLLRVLLGQLPVTQGQVRVFGAPPRRGNPRVGYVAQQRPLPRDLPISGLELVRFGVDGHRWGPGRPLSRAGRAAVDSAIEAVGATTYTKRRIAKLSGGEQQRLRIAQAVVSGPELLLADEPLAFLDAASQRQVAALLDDRRHDGMTVLVVTHEIEPFLPHADQVLSLTDLTMHGGR